MPVKTCLICDDVHWARWRNTPAVCDMCVARVVVCPGCWSVTCHTDPAQLSLFTAEQMLRRRGVQSIAAIAAYHFANRVPRNFDWASYARELFDTRSPWPHVASESERRRYPFH